MKIGGCPPCTHLPMALTDDHPLLQLLSPRPAGLWVVGYMFHMLEAIGGTLQPPKAYWECRVHQDAWDWGLLLSKG